MKRRLLVLLLIFAIILSSVSVCFGAGKTEAVEVTQAGILKALHLFKGVSDTDFALYRAPTRPEALVMLIRLLGAEETALNYEGSHPFTDVPKWCDKYVAYAYGNGLTKGTSATTFGTGNANAAMYTTFVLRSLGYSDNADGDFTYSKSVEFAKSAGFDFSDINVKNFQRADVVKLSFDALRMKDKRSKDTLAEKLLADGVFTSEEYRTAMAADTTRIQLPETAPNGVSYAEMAKVYCGDSNLSYIVNPKTYEDHLNNINYVLLTGNWQYSDYDARDFKRNSKYWVFVGDSYEGQFLEFPKDPALFGCFANGSNDIGFYYHKGKYYYARSTVKKEWFYSPEEIQRQILESYVFVKNKYDEFRETGQITESSTEYEKAKLYSDWFNTFIINQPPETLPDPTFETRGIGLRFCPAYSSLITLNGICTSRCAAFCLMMRMEGITVHGLINGHEGKTIGHIVPWMLLDGKEYVYEHNSSLGLLEVDKVQECSVFNGGKFHQFQRYFYSRILKEEGLEYDNSLDGKVYWDNNGNPLSWTEWYAYLKNQQ